jgi:formamidopyrimidine-DNA glycosylase
MPELPEVETIRRGLVPVLEGARLVRVLQRRADLRVPFPANFAARLTGQRVTMLERRGKYLIGHLEGGEWLVIHLGMSGRFTVLEAGGAARPGRFVHGEKLRGTGEGAHDHVVFDTDAGRRIVFSDHRRFGMMTLIPQDETLTYPLFAALGVEPLGPDLTAEYLTQHLRASAAPIKNRLLDQRLIAGLGNIYVCEALHRACISPLRRAHQLTRRSASAKVALNQLVLAIPAVLNEAILAGGSSLRDYARTDGKPGYFQHNFAVYGREKAPCLRCGPKARIRRIVQAGRSSFYCGTCQK